MNDHSKAKAALSPGSDGPGQPDPHDGAVHFVRRRPGVGGELRGARAACPCASTRASVMPPVMRYRFPARASGREEVLSQVDRHRPERIGRAVEVREPLPAGEPLLRGIEPRLDVVARVLRPVSLAGPSAPVPRAAVHRAREVAGLVDRARTRATALHGGGGILQRGRAGLRLQRAAGASEEHGEDDRMPAALIGRTSSRISPSRVPR